MNQRNEAMLTVQQTGFAVTELALYLDTHPTDAAALSAMRTAAGEYDAAVSAYERQYGPLSIKTAAGPDSWNWSCGPWPWEEA